MKEKAEGAFFVWNAEVGSVCKFQVNVAGCFKCAGANLSISHVDFSEYCDLSCGQSSIFAISYGF